MLFLFFILVWHIFIKMDIKYFCESQFGKTFPCRNYIRLTTLWSRNLKQDVGNGIQFDILLSFRTCLLSLLNNVPNVIERTKSHMLIVEKKTNECNNCNLEILLTSYGKLKSLSWFLLSLTHCYRCLRNAGVNETLCLFLLFETPSVISDFCIWIFLPIDRSHAVL